MYNQSANRGTQIVPIRPHRAARSVVAALTLGALVSLPLALSWVGPAAAARPTASPTSALPTATPSHYVPGQHIYDNGHVLSSDVRQAAETSAADIEARGGGRVAVMTAATQSGLPDANALLADWRVDGMVVVGTPPYSGTLLIGGTLKGKLSTEQYQAFEASPGSLQFDSWLTSSLARADGFLAGSSVWDGTGILDANAKTQVEASARGLSARLGAPVYVDVSVGSKDPSATAYANASHLSAAFTKSGALVVALSVANTRIGGNIQTGNPNLRGLYQTGTPWQTTTLAADVATPADVAAQLVAAVKAVGTNSAGANVDATSAVGTDSPGAGAGDSGESGGLPGILPVVVLALCVATAVYVVWLLIRFSGNRSNPDRPGEPAAAPDGAPESASDPQRAAATTQAALSAAAPSTAPSPGVVAMQFGADAHPSPGDVSSLVGAVRSGDLPTAQGSAGRLLAAGLHGEALVTACQPLGKLVRDLNPNAPADRLDDPIWVFTVQISVPGEPPFAAVFGHRVPQAKLSSVGPDARLVVAVDPSNRNQVAIDWDRSPIVDPRDPNEVTPDTGNSN